jgi:peptide/nickel transport system ATP-binding protein
MSASSPVLVVDGLKVQSLAGRQIVDGVGFSLARGEAIGIVGESGSGKTTTALAVLGYVRPGMRVTGGTVSITGRTMALDDEHAARALRGSVVSHVPQDPGTSLNPALRIRAAIADMLTAHGRKAPDAAVFDALSRVDLPGTRGFARRFPHQLSGGQQQRVLIANSLVCEPPLIVFDEPTTGLDVITQARVLEEIERLHRDGEVSMVYVSHDLAVVSQVCDQIVVMYDGRIVEAGRGVEVLARPRHEYTQRLIAACPDHAKPRARPASRRVEVSTVLDVDGLRAVHHGRDGTVVAAQDVSFQIGAGECVALVGQSGSGKSTIARTIAGLHPPDGGRILLHGQQLAPHAKLRTREQRRRCQIIFQNPYESLNPRRTVADEIARPAVVLRGISAGDVEVDRFLERVRLPARLGRLLPGELSGGERQRVAIARALAANPELLICDEITSALDVSVQATVLDLLDELQTELGLSLLFITHNLGVVATIADRVLVLAEGQICETGEVADIFLHPKEPYTRALLEAAPRIRTTLPAPALEPTYP